MFKITDTERKNIINGFIESGVFIPCSDGIIIDKNAVIGKGTTVLPNTVIDGSCVIGSDCVIGPGCFLADTKVGDNTTLNNTQSENAEIGSGVTCGPYVHIRPNSFIKNNVHIGNFVEVKNSTVDDGTKLPHLLYIGDSDVGKDVNFGCGCVTVNYDGKNKSRTTVKDGAFIGCNTNLVAPVTVGNNAYTAAGSTVTGDVPDNALVIARVRQVVKKDWVLSKKPYKRQHTEK